MIKSVRLPLYPSGTRPEGEGIFCGGLWMGAEVSSQCLVDRLVLAPGESLSARRREKYASPPALKMIFWIGSEIRSKSLVNGGESTRLTHPVQAGRCALAHHSFEPPLFTRR